MSSCGASLRSIRPSIAIGESTYVRYHLPTLQSAVYGLFSALVGWRGVATHLSRLPDDTDRQWANTVLRSIPPELRSARESGSLARWMADPMALRRVCEEAVRTLLALPVGTPSLRLLADEAAKVLAGMADALNGLALLVDAPYPASAGHRGFRLSGSDWMPALVRVMTVKEWVGLRTHGCAGVDRSRAAPYRTMSKGAQNALTLDATPMQRAA